MILITVSRRDVSLVSHPTTPHGDVRSIQCSIRLRFYPPAYLVLFFHFLLLFFSPSRLIRYPTHLHLLPVQFTRYIHGYILPRKFSFTSSPRSSFHLTISRCIVFILPCGSIGARDGIYSCNTFIYSETAKNRRRVLRSFNAHLAI